MSFKKFLHNLFLVLYHFCLILCNCFKELFLFCLILCNCFKELCHKFEVCCKYPHHCTCLHICLGEKQFTSNKKSVSLVFRPSTIQFLLLKQEKTWMKSSPVHAVMYLGYNLVCLALYITESSHTQAYAVLMSVHSLYCLGIRSGMFVSEVQV